MTEHIGVRLYADVVHSYSRGVLRGIADYAKVHGWWDFTFHPRIETDFTSTFASDGVRGVIIQIRKKEHADKLIASGVAAVNVSNLASLPQPLPAVFPDDVAAGCMAGNYFLDRGFRHFAFFGQGPGRYARQRADGFFETIRAAGCQCSTFFLPGPDSDGHAGLASATGPASAAEEERLAALASLPKPLAVFCSNDSVARRAVRDAVKLGLHVPDQVAVLGVDNDEINCELAGVQLSSIRLNTEQIGYEAAGLLAKLIAGQPAPAEPILVPPMEVITRRSTDVLALADTEVATVVRFIRDKGGRGINVQDLLDKTMLSRRSLEMRFRKALGRSPYQEIRRVQLERAKLLLSRTDQSVRQIADACGFSEARQLSTAFHERIGLTPRQYRRKARRSPQTGAEAAGGVTAGETAEPAASQG